MVTRMLADLQTIVVDEVQDLLAPLYFDVIDLVLQGGLAAGRRPCLVTSMPRCFTARIGAKPLVVTGSNQLLRKVLAPNELPQYPPHCNIVAPLGKLSPNYDDVFCGYMVRCRTDH